MVSEDGALVCLGKLHPGGCNYWSLCVTRESLCVAQLFTLRGVLQQASPRKSEAHPMFD